MKIVLAYFILIQKIIIIVMKVVLLITNIFILQINVLIIVLMIKYILVHMNMKMHVLKNARLIHIFLMKMINYVRPIYFVVNTIIIIIQVVLKQFLKDIIVIVLI